MTYAAGANLKSQLIRPIAERLRALVRRDEIGLIFLGLLSGCIAGLLAAGYPRKLTFSALLPIWARASERARAARLAAAGAGPHWPAACCSAFLEFSSTNWRPQRPVDPIEANALRGGRMSLADSTVITAQTVISNGFGASVGLEAAYTQMGSGFASLSAACSGCGAPICGCWSLAVRQAPSARPSGRLSPAHFTHSN